MSRSVVIGRTADASTLNPVLYADLPTGEVVNRLFDHLVLTDPEGHFCPGRLLERWTVSEDGLRWAFHLRGDAYWHDGRPVTAQDACFTLATMLDPEVASPRRSEFLVDGEPLRFTAAGAHELRIELPAPFAPFLSSLAWRPLIPRHRFVGRGVRESPDNVAPVGSGPFAFAGWRPGEELKMRAWRRHHAAPPAVDEVVWRCMPDQDAAVEALLAGSVDYVPGIPPALAAGVEGAPRTRLVRSLDSSFTYLGLRLGRMPFGDVRVRRALQAAIDRRGLVASALQGEGHVAAGPVAPTSPWHAADVMPAAYDPRCAGALLDAADWPVGADGARRGPAGEALAFTIATVAGDAVKAATAEHIVADLARIGVSAAVEALPMAELLRERAFTGRFDALLLGLAPGLDPTYLHAVYHSAMRPPAGWNVVGWEDPVADALLEASQRELCTSERRSLLRRVQRRVADAVPLICLFHPGAVDAAADRLRLPPLPALHANRFMYLHDWGVTDVSARTLTAS